jgi:hypothetical protein
MRQAPSLEEERRALLAQIESSREAYRHMLHPRNTVTESPASGAARHLQAAAPFPRSATMRWIMDHPYLSALAVASVVIMLRPPRRMMARAPKVRGPLLKGATAMAAMLLRDPSKLRMAGNLFTAGRNFIRQRRASHR